MPTIHDAAPDHDEALIVRLAAEDLHGREADAARARVAECPACAELLGDIRAIMAATAALPAPRRSRDFRLTEADAARLRPIGWRRVLGLFNQPSLAFTRPLATGLATLGIVGLLVTVLPGGFGAGGAATFSTTGGPVAESGGAVGAPAPLAPEASAAGDAARSADTAASPGQVPGPAAAANQASPPAGSPAAAPPAANPGLAPGVAAQKGLVSAAPSGGALPGTAAPVPLVALAPEAVTPRAASSAGPSPLAVLSVSLLVVGLGLAGLRRAARRLA